MKHNNLKKALEKLGKVELVEKKVHDPCYPGAVESTSFTYRSAAIVNSWRFQGQNKLVIWSEEEGCLRVHPFCTALRQEKSTDSPYNCLHGWFGQTIKSIVGWVKNAH